jgi:hypothetical protein
MSERRYSLVSSLVFAAVALGHLLRAIAGWPIVLGDWQPPLAVSWAVALGAGALAAWGLRRAARTG